MVERQELPGAIHASVINADDTPEENKKSESRDSPDSTWVHLSYASIRHGPSERVLSGHDFIANVSLEKTLEAPPSDPAKHLSCPDTHPTPGQ